MTAPTSNPPPSFSGATFFSWCSQDPPAETISNLIEEIALLLDQAVIQETQEAKSLLERKLEFISVRRGQDSLQEEDQRFYNLSQQLINSQGCIRAWCLQSLQETPNVFYARERHDFDQITHFLNSCNYFEAGKKVLNMNTLYTFKTFLESEVNEQNRLALAQALLEKNQVRGKEIIKIHFPSFPYPAAAFGKEKWERYFGTIEEEPPLPVNTIPILKSDCPFWRGRLVEDTHFLVLIPVRVNGAPFNLQLLQQLIQRPDRSGHPANYTHFYAIADMIQRDYGHKCVERSYWTLITKEPLPNSHHKTYQEQQCLIPKGYTTPKMVEISTGLLAMQIESGSCPYQKSSWTRCEEIFSNGYRATIGYRVDYDQLLTGQTADQTKSYVCGNSYSVYSLGLVRRLT